MVGLQERPEGLRAHRTLVERALVGLRRGQLAAVCLPAPVAPLESLLALPVSPLAAWHGDGGQLIVGLGEAGGLAGADGIRLAAAAADLYARVRGPAPPLLGG